LLGLPLFKDMRLAGGTSLALQLGHRRSVDLDFFGTLQTDEITLSGQLTVFEKITWLKRSANINIFSIDGIKVDFVNYRYPWIEEMNTEDGLRLAGPRDIAAMKLAAITGRGTKKDFIDIYFLLQQYSLREMMSFYNKKYADGSDFLVLKSLTYFEDAEQEQEPVMLTNVNWKAIKEVVLQKHNEYINA
jgi:predicted nucleotidyltransferase component of viral defense system